MLLGLMPCGWSFDSDSLIISSPDAPDTGDQTWNLFAWLDDTLFCEFEQVVTAVVLEWGSQ